MGVPPDPPISMRVVLPPVFLMTAQLEPSIVMLLMLMVSCDVVMYVPQGKRSVSPPARAEIALLMAAVSLVSPLPIAPKFKTLIVTPLLDTLTVTEVVALLPEVSVARAVRV